MIKVRPYEKGDSFKMELLSVYQPAPMHKEMADIIGGMANAIVWTIYDDECDKVYAVVGLTFLWDGVAEAWALLTETVSEFKIAFHKRILNGIQFYTEKMKIKRMHISVKADFKKGIEWAESLGFKKESLMKKWGPEGADYYQYVRLT